MAREAGEIGLNLLLNHFLNVFCEKKTVDGFLEELIVRRELSDNFVHYQPQNYDRIEGLSNLLC